MKNINLKEIKKEDYKKVFNYLVNRTCDYVMKDNLKSLILGISGGIDSTVVSFIAEEVHKRMNIPFIGYSIRIKNKEDEASTSLLVGQAFCDEFYMINLKDIYSQVSEGFKKLDKVLNPDQDTLDNLISEGNIMARLRMMYLYRQAGNNKGIVLDTDNLTEHNLGFWTIHGDEGDFNPIGGLWKSEIYKLAKWRLEDFDKYPSSGDKDFDLSIKSKVSALKKSIDLIPTDGNGISSSDLEQIGGKDYYEVDRILRPIVVYGESVISKLVKSGEDPNTVQKIYNRFKNSEFKRRTSRTVKITREDIFNELNY